ncbi:MAG TPA: hypothetical protein VME46_25555, partial [Acidimicrobiales bacterium]|nr:hypothetical protein [Acidimicrobiales bacterium]
MSAPGSLGTITTVGTGRRACALAVTADQGTERRPTGVEIDAGAGARISVAVRPAPWTDPKAVLPAQRQQRQGA